LGTNPYANYGYAVLTAQALRAPDDVAVTYLGRHVTYGELDHRVNRRANALAAAGVSPGTRVACLLGETLTIAELYLAQAKLGSVLAAMNPYWSDEVLVSVIQATRCPVFLFDGTTEPVVTRIRDRLPDMATWIRAGGPAAASVDLDRLTERAPDTAPVVGVSGDDVLAMFFTSGTTGLPKAVAHTHASAISIAQIRLDVPRAPGCAFATGPIIWGVGFAVIAGPALYGGVRLVLENDFGPRNFLEVVPRERVTHISVIPSFFSQLLGDDAHVGVDLDSIQVIMLGAEPLLPSLLERIRARLPKAMLYSYYGQTEAPYSCWARQDDGSVPLTASGRARTSGAVRVVDPAGQRVTNEVGEIQLTGPHLMTRYDGLPDATANVLRDGWYVGGDVGVLDDSGVLTVLGRREDTIRKAGHWTLPSAVEDVVLALPDVAEAGAVGVPEWADEQRILVAVLPREGRRLNRTDVEQQLEHLPDALRPDAVVVVDELPHAQDASGGRGKLLRREIRSRWGALLEPADPSVPPPGPA
jgi:acyl-CoA synthetase (AMP-forming)/AMP-acid ligase II